MATSTSTKATLKGVVTNKSDSKPIKDARVEVLDEGTAIKSVNTKDDGNYTIDDLEKSKTYTLKVFVGEVERYKGDVTLDAQTKTQDIPVEIPVPAPTPSEPVPDEFDELGATIKPIPIDAPVSIEEAIQLRRLYTVGCYLLAKVPQSIPALKDDIGNNGPITGILYNRVNGTLISEISAVCNDIISLNNNDDLSMEKILRDLREQCDLGTGTAGKVNLEFKSIFKEFVGLCTDELLAVDYREIKPGNINWDAKEQEEFRKYCKKLIRVIIKLTRNMSVAGTMNPKERVLAWAKIINNSIDILFNEISPLVHAPDEDEKHLWSVVAKLNDMQKSDIKTYLVQAKEGGYMLQYAIDIYKQLEKDRKAGKNVEDDDEYISNLIHGTTQFLLEGKTVSAALRAIATSVWENWPPVWT